MTNEAASWNALAAAELARADRDNSGEATLDALTAVNRAFVLDPQYGPTRFNRALILTRLGLLHEAASIARAFFHADTRSPWAAEAVRESQPADLAHAETRSAILERFRAAREAGANDTLRMLTRMFPQYARIWGEGVVLSDWAEAWLSSDAARAEKQLSIARMVGAEMKSATGECLLADAAAAIGRSPATDRVLAVAQRTYRTGRVAHQNGQNELAERSFRAAAEAFARTGSPMAFVSRYYLGSSLYVQFRVREAAMVLDALQVLELRQRGYRALSAEIGWERGLCSMVSGAFSDALQTLEQSRQIAVEQREGELAAKLEALSAEALDFIARPDEAWTRRRNAFQRLSNAGDERRTIVALVAAAEDRGRHGQWERAATIFDLAAAAALRLGDAELITSTLGRRSLARAKLGRIDDAMADSRKAREWMARLTDLATRNRAAADLAIADAITNSSVDPKSAIADLDRAVAYYAQTAPSYLPPILLERARQQRRRGDIAAARRDLVTGIDMIERYRTGVRDLQQRADMFAAAEGLAAEAESIAIATNDLAGAFQIMERSRARVMLDALGLTTRTSVAPLPLAAVRAALAPNAAVVAYLQVDARLYAFVVKRTAAAIMDCGRADRVTMLASQMRDAMLYQKDMSRW